MTRRLTALTVAAGGVLGGHLPYGPAAVYATACVLTVAAVVGGAVIWAGERA